MGKKDPTVCKRISIEILRGKKNATLLQMISSRIQHEMSGNFLASLIDYTSKIQARVPGWLSPLSPSDS